MTLAEKLAAWRKVHEAATPGPWQSGRWEVMTCYPARIAFVVELPVSGPATNPENLDAIALAHNTYAELLAVAESASGVNDAFLPGGGGLILSVSGVEAERRLVALSRDLAALVEKGRAT